MDGRFDSGGGADYNFRDACSAATRGASRARASRSTSARRGCSCAGRSPASRPSWPALFAEAFGHTEVPHRVDAVAAAPRVLDLGELEAVRDGLADRVAEARQALVERRRVEDDNRELVERMLAAPQDYKWVRVSRADLGLPGCGHWHSRPRSARSGC